MEYANGNIAKEAGRIVDWREKFWSRRYAGLWVSEEEAAQVDRMRYVLSHGAKENIVASPRQWPGLHCIDALVEGKPLDGVWYDRSAQYEADRQGKDVDPRAFISEYQLKLEPLPCWAHLSPEEYSQRISEMVEDIEAETARRIILSGKVPLGAEAVRHQNPHQRANRPKKSPAPFCHAASKAVRKQLREAYRIFIEAYHEASAQLRSGNRNAQFPEGCFPPALPFVREDNPTQPVRAGP